MSNPLSVHEAIDGLAELAGHKVAVFGRLSLEFEGTCLNHLPKSECRDSEIGNYHSSIWVDFDLQTLQQDERWLEQFDERHVQVVGKLFAPDLGYDGCGHFGMWPAMLTITDIKKLPSIGNFS